MEATVLIKAFSRKIEMEYNKIIMLKQQMCNILRRANVALNPEFFEGDI